MGKEAKLRINLRDSKWKEIATQYKENQFTILQSLKCRTTTTKKKDSKYISLSKEWRRTSKSLESHISTFKKTKKKGTS